MLLFHCIYFYHFTFIISLNFLKLKFLLEILTFKMPNASSI